LDGHLKFLDQAASSQTIVRVPRLDRIETVGQPWIFTPASVGPPFSLGTSAKVIAGDSYAVKESKKVVGLNADWLDGYDTSEGQAGSTLPVRTVGGQVQVSDPRSMPTGAYDAINQQFLNNWWVEIYPSGIVPVSKGGTGVDHSGASNIGGLVWKSTGSVLAVSTALTGVVIGNGTSAPTAQMPLSVGYGGTGGTDRLTARTGLDVLWADDSRGLVQARRPRGGIHATGAAAYMITSPTGLSFGLGDFSIRAVVRLNDYSVSGASTLLASHITGNSRVVFGLSAAGGFLLLLVDAGGATTGYWDVAPDVPFVAGEIYDICVTVDRDGLATFYANGITDRDKNGTKVTANVAATAAIDIGNGNASAWGYGYNVQGTIYTLQAFNILLSEAQVLTLASSGTPAYGDQWGSLVYNYTSNFSAGVDGFTAAGGTIVGNVNNIGGQNANQRFTSDATNGIHYTRRSILAKDKRYRLQASVYIPSTNTTLKRVRIQGGGTPYAAIITTLDAWVIIDQVVTADHDLVQFFGESASAQSYQGTAGDVFYIGGVNATAQGAVLDLDLENADPIKSLSIKDRSSNNNHGTMDASLRQVLQHRQINAETLLISSLAPPTSTATLLYAGTGGLVGSISNDVSGVPATNNVAARFLTNIGTGPYWSNLYASNNVWTNSNDFTTGAGLVFVKGPTSGLHAANKDYVDAAVSAGAAGISVKAECDLATTANITLSGNQTIDGVLTVTSNRILVKNQTNQAENGVYNAGTGAWTRSNDLNDAVELTKGAYTFIKAGATQAGTSWIQTELVTTVGTSIVNWAKFFQQAAYVPGAGISITGLTISVNMAYTPFNWTGLHTFTNPSGVQLLPHSSAGGATTHLRFYQLATGGSNYVALRAPDAIFPLTNLVWALPSAEGASGDVMQTNGAGILSFGKVSSGSITNANFVTSVGGTFNRIDVTVGLQPVVNISPNYVGQTSITTLGTFEAGTPISVGTWRADPIAAGYGGTGRNNLVLGDLLYAAGPSVAMISIPIAGTTALIAPGTVSKFLNSSGTVPQWSAFMVPMTMNANDIWVGYSGTAMGRLPTQPNSILTTDASGLVNWRTTLPPGVVAPGGGLVKGMWQSIGNGVAKSIDVTHNFATKDVIVQLYENTSTDGWKQQPLVPTTRPDSNKVTLEFLTTPTTDQYKVFIMALV